ncbi:MAG: tRNA lysidine(34) synthetase TilS [Acidobacteriota bacterium]|nr:tRNA lysidine(34) synthetase TilS [Acidobacteriota bacterium]
MTTTSTSTRRQSTRTRLSRFAGDLLEEWRRLKLPFSGANIVVGVSGGADSSALLLALDELIKAERLSLKLIVGHLDHGLRPDSKKDAQWVSGLAEELGYPAAVARTNLKTSAGKRQSNLEQAARNARYKFFQKTAQQKKANFVLTAHTLDDQAETVLMRLLRGSAAEGLSGTTVIRSLAENSTIQLVRPLLSWARRADTENYCRLRQIEFRHDEMNDDESFSRVRVRNQLLPLMKSFNNRIVETLSRTAALLNEDATALATEASRLVNDAGQQSNGKNKTKQAALDVHILLQSPPAVRRRALREWILRGRGDLRRLEMVHLIAVEKLLEGDKGGRVAELPGGMKVTRRRGMLELSSKKRLKKAAATPKIPAR